MADLQNHTPPRISLFGRRLRPSMLAFGALLALACVPAYGQEEGGALPLGAASFNAGKYELAVRQLTTAINSEGLSPENTAKALYFRGLAQQRLGQSGRAISDLGAAIFLGLSQEERVSALVNRGLAYRAAGLSGQAEAEIAQARKLGGSGAVEELVARSGTSPREAAAMTSFSTEVRSASGRETIASTPAAAPAPLPDATSPSAQPESGNRLTRWWGSMRGNSPEAAPAAPPPPAATAEAKPEVVAQGWSTHTEASQSATARAPAPAAPPPAWSTHTEAAGTAEQGTRYASAAPEAPAPTGNFRLQLSPTRSESEAMALWKQVSSQNQQVAGLNPSIEKTDMGNLGTFYRLQIGPFPSKAESLKVCNALKRGGVDCFLVTN